MLKKDLREKGGISANAMAKMTKGRDVSAQVIRQICVASDCNVEDIIEIEKD